MPSIKRATLKLRMIPSLCLVIRRYVSICALHGSDCLDRFQFYNDLCFDEKIQTTGAHHLVTVVEGDRTLTLVGDSTMIKLNGEGACVHCFQMSRSQFLMNSNGRPNDCVGDAIQLGIRLQFLVHVLFPIHCSPL